MRHQGSTLEKFSPTIYSDLASRVHEDVSMLLDEEVLLLSNLRMSDEQDERVDYLQTKGKEGGLSPTEEAELLELMQIYCLGLLHKAQGLAEAVCRGLREPLHP